MIYFLQFKNLVKIFFLLLTLAFFVGCASSEKDSYDSLLIQEEKPVKQKRKKASLRKITSLQTISQLKEDHFQFVAKQMKKVIRNYQKMKQQLISIEAKLDKFLAQSLLNRSRLHEDSINNSIVSEKSKEDLIAEITAGKLSLDKENQEDLLKVLQSKDDRSALIEDVLDNKWDLNEEDKNYLLKSLGYKSEGTAPSIEEEITDDTNIFQDGEDNKKPLIENQQSAFEKLETRISASVKPSSLINAKNLFEKKSYENAISQFQKYRDENPEGSFYPEATFYIGESFKKLKMPIEANIFFKEIVQTYPQSLWASRAQKNLEE